MIKYKSIIFSFFFIFISQQSLAEKNIVYIDLDKLIQETNYGKKITKLLKELNDDNIENLKKKENILKTKEDQINSKKNLLSEEQYNIELKKFQSEIIKFRTEKNKIVENFNNVKNEEIKNFFLKIKPYLEDFMNENSYSILLDKKLILIGKSNFEITDEFIKKINTMLEYNE